jgi:6-phosphogluconolactonase (cycloisomerase 2 family)
MSDELRSARPVVGRVNRATKLQGLAILFFVAFGSVSANAQTSGFVYVANAGFGGVPGNVSAYTIDDSTGALTAVPGSPFPAGVAPRSVTVDPTGRFLYVANCGNPCFNGANDLGDIYAFSIDGATGTLTSVAGSPFPAELHPHHLTADPTGKFVYVVNVNSNNISAYTINGATGALSAVPGSPFPAGFGPAGVTVDPTGRFVYVANGGSVTGYSIDGAMGALTPVPGSPFLAPGVRAFSVTVNPTGQFVYATDSNSNGVLAYTIDAATGNLTAVSGSPFLSGSGPLSVTVTPAGQFVYVANFSSNSVSGYTINGATGALTAVPGSPFSGMGLSGSFAAAVDASSKFVYVTNQNPSSISALTVDPATGALIAVPGSPFPTGVGPLGIATTPGPFLFGAPTNKDQCKGNGWKMFRTPRTFKNQGDCIQFVKKL